MAKSALSMTVDKVADVLAGIKNLATLRVMVGVPEEKGARSSDAPINNAALAYIHDKGAPEAGIPARPFLETGIASEQGKIADGLTAAADDAFDGNVEAMNRKLNAVGLIAASAVKRKITTGPFQPLAPSTLAKRRARGRTGTKPLIDTAQMRNAVTYVVRKT